MDRSPVPAAVRIDLGSLRQFADTLKADSDNGLRPGVDRARHEALTGVHFGARTLSGEVAAGAEAMAAALARAQQNGSALVDAAEILVQAANQVLANYAKADLASAEQLAAVETTLRDAASAVAKEYLIVRSPQWQQPI